MSARTDYINATILSDAKALGLLRDSETAIAKLPTAAREAIVSVAKELAERLECTRYDIAICIWSALTPHSGRAFGNVQVLDFDPYRDRKSTLEWCARLDREHHAALNAATRQQSLTG